ncbi:MarR family transcriptional regulator [Anaerobacterium chartisolvens]|uniref:MarR family transcriptional regulator n=1 Tax=Anaerobacterium chartisolvens TaxID=1297424 RepID=A0A369B4J7_9FIRM|nr:MarR family transcriptional regulator [Anaerobacterium chartisolvens]RCX15446.1 MarR family transcriptional regulator [Anaerobacterium chartisolvens]
MNREILVENLIEFLPILYKKFFKGLDVCEITKQQFELLYCVGQWDEKPMTYYCSKMLVSKSNLSIIADRLIEEGFLERNTLPEDRRVILLRLSEKGRGFLCDQTNKFKKEIINKLEKFDENDIKRLNEIMQEAREIVTKLD